MESKDIDMTDERLLLDYTRFVDEVTSDESKDATAFSDALDIIDELTKDSEHELVVNFRQHLYWDTGAYNQEQVDEIAVFDPTHVLHEEFLEHLQVMHKHRAVNHNFHHLL